MQGLRHRREGRQCLFHQRQQLRRLQRQFAADHLAGDFFHQLQQIFPLFTFDMGEKVVHFSAYSFQRLRRLNKLFAPFLLPGEAAFGVTLASPLGKTLLMTFAKALLLTFGHSLSKAFLQPFLKTVHQLALVIGGADAGGERFSGHRTLARRETMQAIAPAQCFNGHGLLRRLFRKEL